MKKVLFVLLIVEIVCFWAVAGGKELPGDDYYEMNARLSGVVFPFIEEPSLDEALLGDLFLPAIKARADSLDDRWVSMNPEMPGTNGEIRAMVRRGDYLYIGGSFSFVKNIWATNVARLHIPTGEWSPLGSGMGGGGVGALAFDSTGNLYVGGDFATAGGVEAQGIAMWDGNQWSALGSGMDNEVNAVAFDSTGNLYAGGGFLTAGGVSANNIAKWDGTQWSALGSGMGGVDSPSVYALAFDSKGDLYAGGGFLTAGGVSANYIAKWDGTQWSALGSGMGDVDYSSVSALAFDSKGDLYAGGGFSTAGGVSANNIAKWDGTQWSALGSGITDGLSPSVSALAFDSAGNLYAGGNFMMAGGVKVYRIAKWNGTNWSALGSGVTDGFFPSVSALALDSGGNLYAGGRFMTAGGIGVNNIAKWDDTHWSLLGTGTNSDVSTLAFDRVGNLYAGGNFMTAGGVKAHRIAKWDGTNWSALESGISGGTLPFVLALTLDSVGNLYAGGNFTTAGDIWVSNIAKWDGTQWSALGSGMDNEVNALAVDSAGNLYAGGKFTTAGDIRVNHIAKWDGTQWSALGDGILYGEVRSLAFDNAGNLYVGGAFTTAGGVETRGIAKWDGVNWNALGDGILYGEVQSLAFDNAGNLYVGGIITTAGGIEVNNIAKWDGTQWSALGSRMNMSDYVFALAFDSAGNLYAGGKFTVAGGAEANNIAKWNGANWSALGNGTDGNVSVLVVDSGENLYAGGDFMTAGGKVSPYIAKYRACSSNAECNDNSLCTVDVCQGETGACTYTPGNEGAACDDHDPLTEDDHCISGSCKGTPIETDVDSVSSDTTGTTDTDTSKGGNSGCSCTMVF